ncbi:MAG: DoxX family protein [Gemmatimonadaceae bacterium]
MQISDTFTYLLLQILASLFLAILFLQSGIDKIVDHAGNLEYHSEHFAKSPLAGTVGPMLLVLTVLETLSGLLNGIGCLMLVFIQDPTVAFWGAVLSAFTFCALFFGQRMSKDYAGAASMPPYFLVGLAAIWLLGVNHLVAR